MSDSRSKANVRKLKETWQEYLKATGAQEKEEKLKGFLKASVSFNDSQDKSLALTDSEVSSIGNLLGCELLKVISNQCEVLEHDSALVHYFQQGSGLYLLQALNILADQVNSCNSEVSNVLASVLPCLLSVQCDLDDNIAFSLLQKLCTLYKDATSGKQMDKNLCKILDLSLSSSSSTELSILQLFALVLDTINRLSLKGSSLAIAESSFNIAEKLTVLLLEFSRSNRLVNSNNRVMNEEFPECTWSHSIKLVCMCMVMYPLWAVSSARGSTQVFSHRIDQSELVDKLLQVLAMFKDNILDASGFKNPDKITEEERDILCYQLFLMYSLLAFLLTLLKNSVSCEAISHSGLDLTRRIHSKEQVEIFMKSGGLEILLFVSHSLNKILTDESKINKDCCTLPKQKAIAVVSATGQLVSALKNSMTSVSKSEDQKMEFSLDRVSASAKGRQEFRFSRSRSSTSQACTTESSSDSDNEPSHSGNLKQIKYHSREDCVISCFCCALLTFYEGSTVEEMDVVCLTALSRSGMCCCMDVSATTTSLLSRFVGRSSPVQDLAMSLFSKTLLTQANLHTLNSAKPLENSAIFTGTDDVFSSEEDRMTTDNFSCLENLFLLLTEGELTVKILKHLKAMAKFGSARLREALFTKVIHPFVLKYRDLKRVNALSQVCRKFSVHSSNPYDSGYGTPTEANEKDVSLSESSSSSQPQKSKSAVSDDALRISLHSLMVLLETDRLQRLFLNSNGVKSILHFLGDESLHPVCLGILQLLAMQEERDLNGWKPRVSRDDSFKKKSLESFSENRQPVVVNILVRSMLLIDPAKEDFQKSKAGETSVEDFAVKIRISLKSSKVSRLLCQLWRTCLELLRRNSIFRELFLQFNGPAHVVTLLQVVKECLYTSSSSNGSVRDETIACIILMMHGVAVGLEFEKETVDRVQVGIQINEAVRIIQRLVRQDKRLKEIAGRTFCISLLHLAVGAVAEECSSKADIHDSDQLLLDVGNSDESECEDDVINTKQSKVRRGYVAASDVEPGYEADAEQDTGLSEVSGKENGSCRGKERLRDSLPKRRAETILGHVCYPQMCEELVRLLEYNGEITVNDRVLILFGLEGIIDLATYSVRNRQILCRQGILLLVLKTFTPCLASADISMKAVQKTILDLVVVLAEYEITSEEMRLYLKLLEKNKPSLLIKALRTISSSCVSSHGPSYTHVFPPETSISYRSLISCQAQFGRSFKKASPKRAKEKKQAHSVSSHSAVSSAPGMEMTFPCSSLIKPVELQVNQSLPWPVGSFSLAFWLYLDSGSTAYNDREHHGKTLRRKLSRMYLEHLPSGDRARKPEKEKLIHVLSFGTEAALFEVLVNVGKMSLICRWSSTQASSGGSAVTFQETFVNFSIKDYAWSHLVLSVQAGPEDDVSAGKVTLIVDGSCETTKALPYPSIPVRKNEQVSVLIGETENNKPEAGYLGGGVQPQPFYYLGNVSVFIGDLHRDGSPLADLISLLNASSMSQEKFRSINVDEASYLYLLGANCHAIDFHLAEDTLPSYSNHLDVAILSKLPEASSKSFVCGPHGEPVLIDAEQMMDIKISIKKQLLLVYSPSNPSAFLEYKLAGTNWGENQSHWESTRTGVVCQNVAMSAVPKNRFVEAVNSVGGIGVFVYLFAKIVEKMDDERVQADALEIIFTLAKENIIYAKELEGLVANKMILKVLLTPHCSPGYHFAKVFFYAACEGEVFRETGLNDKPYVVNFNTSAIVKNFEILRDFLLNWRIWYRSACSFPWETILLALEALTSSTHPYLEFNIQQFERADALGILLLGCQEVQTEDLQFSSRISSLHLNIMQNLLGCPANPQVLKRICEFLVAIHPTYETLVIHAPGNLYFSPIVQLQDRSNRRDVEESYVSCRGNGENAEEETAAGGQSDQTSQTVAGGTSQISQNVTEETCGSGVNATCEANEAMDEIKRNELCHDIAHTNVLNTEDSEDMIITVEHLREKENENNVQFPLQPPDQEKPSLEFPHSASVEFTDNADHSASRVPLEKSNTPFSPDDSRELCTASREDIDALREHGEPIIITSHEASSSVLGSYDVVSSSELNATQPQSSQTSNSTDDYLVVDNTPGRTSTMSTYRLFKRNSSEIREHNKLDELRVGLLELIYSALVNLADTAVHTVLGESLKVEYFLCFVNHSVGRVRTLSIEVLNKILERASSNVVNSFHQMSGYHLLAVQVHLHPITQEVAEACLHLFFRQPVSINQPNFFESINRGSDLVLNVNTQAVVLLLGMLEGSTLCPEVFQFLTQSLVRMLDVVEDFLLKATDHGLLKTFVNAVRALCVWRINNSGKKDQNEMMTGLILDNLQHLVMAIVYRSLRMCGDRYFQIFDELLLYLNRLQYSEPGNKRLTMLLVQCSGFLQHCALRFAFEYFEHTQRSAKLNRRALKKTLRLSFKSPNEKLDLCEGRRNSSVTYWATMDPSTFPLLWQTSRQRSFPADATPTEIAIRFQDVCKKAVSFIYFSDTWRSVEPGLDFNLNYSQFTLPPPFEPYKQADSSCLVNAVETFTQWTFCFLLELLDFCLHDGAQRCLNKWHALVYQSKDKIRHQLCRLFIHLIAPNQDSKKKLFALQLTKMKRGSEIFLNLLLGAITTKQKERSVAYVRSFLREPDHEFSVKEKKVRKIVRECLKDVENQKSDDVEYFTQKQQEWEKQDRSNKMQWENKKEVDRKRGDQELQQLCSRIMSVAMDVTKVSVDVQDKQRQNLLKHVKGALSSDVQSQKLWQMLVKQMTHERAVWYDEVFFPTSWQLDRTEGPCRVRCRLQRCHLDIDEKFIMAEHRKQQSSTLPLSYLFEEHCGDVSSRNVYHIFNTTDTICFLYRCKSIMPSRKVEGEILIGQRHVYFVGEEAVADLNTAQFFLDDEDITSISWLFQEIREVLRRRYALKDNALEIFLTNGRTFLLAFETNHDRETVYKELMAKELPNLITATENVTELTQRWQNGELTNFAYLTELNKQAGRSFNDLMQYPVFPLVLAEYTCKVLDLTNRSVYRDLSKPVAVQNAARVAKFQETYRSLQEQYDISKKLDPMNCIPPYHYGSHYSNSGTVLHFLVRLVPFTKMFLSYQDKQFDVPDRTFHAIETTWNLSSFASAPDVKELIPEFFFLPEFLLNAEGFDFGFRQNGVRVMDVVLPSWASDDVRLFILIHRQALESDVVSSAINKWIDLVFGFKQEGQAAVEAINVFHPSTYVGGIDEKKLLEPIQRQAVQTMIETYGQTPAKLFTEPHPEMKRIAGLDQCSSWSGTFPELENLFSQNVRPLTTERLVQVPQEVPSPVPTVYGIKWGQYVGSPTYPKPVICWSDSFSHSVSRLVSLPGSHLFLLPPNSTHMVVTRSKNKTVHIVWSALLSWNHVDDILRIRDIKKGTTSCFSENINLHKITCCAVSEECRSLWIGSSTGGLCVWPTRYDRNNEHGLAILGRRIRLQGHHARITCVEICEAFSIVVTGSEDRTALIWDLNRLCYVRCLSEHSATVSTVAISPTSGDIVTVCQTGTGNSSELRLWSVNGRFIKKIVCPERITCIQFSVAPEGVSVNAVAAGLMNGVVRLWNTWTLEHIGDIRDDSCQLPLASLVYSNNSRHLFTADSSGTVRAWGRTTKASYKPRILQGAR